MFEDNLFINSLPFLARAAATALERLVDFRHRSEGRHRVILGLDAIDTLVDINLGRVDGSVAHQLLEGKAVHAVFRHPGAEGVAEHMGVDREAGISLEVAEEVRETLVTKRLVVLAKPQRFTVRVLLVPKLEVLFQYAPGPLAERHLPLAGFATNLAAVPVQIKVVREPDSQQLAAPDAGVQEERHHR